MELYAAMIENLDHHLGRLFSYLKKTGKYDNTLIIFFSDNGASPAEFTAYPGTTKAWLERNSDNRFENWGRRGSRIDMGAAWATASNTPLRYFKGLQAEGGIRVPFIAAGPGVTRKGKINSAFTHVMDIAPTLLEIAGVSHPGPGTYKGRKVLPMLGKSMAPFLKGKARVVRSVRDAVGWELFRGRALRQGRWKAIWLDKPFGGGQWQLFDLATDISERNNLAKTKKGRLLLPILVGKWDRYSKSVGVVMPPGPVKLK